MIKGFFLFLSTVALFFSYPFLSGKEFLVHAGEDEQILLDLDPQETLQNLQDKIAALFPNDASKDYYIEPVSSQKSHRMCNLQTSRDQGGYLGHPRNYFAEVTNEEKADIRYIVTTIANKSLISIALIKNEIEEAGDRIDHLHPLRFLMTVFSDEELKAGVRNIRGRGWLWNHFTGGIKESLSTEANIDNLKEIEHVAHFAQTLNLDPNIILPAIRQQRWDDFIDLLITHIPRSGDHDRYDT